MDEILRLYGELINLQQKIDGTPNHKPNIIFDLAEMFNNSVNQNGELPVSEYIKMANYMEATDDVEGANEMRALAQRVPLTAETRLLKPST